MAHKDPRDLIIIPPQDLMGDNLRSLNPLQQRFVCALAVFGGDQKSAYAWAGYKTTNDNSASAAASRLANLPTVKAAIKEEAMRRFEQGELLVVSGLLEMASPMHNDDPKTRLKALLGLADRMGYNAKTEHTITIKDNRSTAQIMQTIQQLAISNGLDPKKLVAPVIDAEFEEVSSDPVYIPGSDGIEDLF